MNNLSSATLTVLIILMIVLSGLFSAIETAYSSASRVHLKASANDHDLAAQRVLHILEDFDRFISTILIANNIVNIVSATLGTVLFVRLLGEDRGAAVSTLVITLVVLLFGEIAPKTIASQIPDTIAKKSVSFVGFLEWLFTPLTFMFRGWQWLVQKFVRAKDEEGDISDELMTMVDEAQKEGDLEEHESDLISAAIEFNDLEVRDVLTPRVDVVAVSANTPVSDVEKVFRLNSFSRIPVYENNVDNIVGVVHQRDLYSALYQFGQKFSLRKVIQPVLYTSENVHISTVLKQLQKAKIHMAVVLDEYGGTAGIITMEDILEELVGEIWDEHDTVREFYTKVTDTCWLVNCAADIDDMFERFNVDADTDDFDFITVSGWVIYQLDGIPKTNAEFDFQNLHITVTKADQRKVLEIKVDIRDTDKKEEKEEK